MNLFDEEKRGKGKAPKDFKSSGGSTNQKKPPELVLKVASNIKGNTPGHSIDYITHNNEKEHGKEGYISPENDRGKKLSKNDLEVLKEQWKKEFSTDKNINSRNMTHLVFSIDIKKTADYQKRFDNAAREFLKARFGDDGFRYIYTQHTDTKNPHIHIIVNNNNLETRKKLRISPEWHRESRMMAKKFLKDNGIEQSASFKRDAERVLKDLNKSVKDSEKDFKECKNWIEAKLKNNARNDEHFNKLKLQYRITTNLLASLKEGAVVHTQERIELANSIRDFQKQLTVYKGFSTNTEVNKTLATLIKDSDQKEKIILSAVKKSAAANKSYESKNLYNHATDLIKAKDILNQSNDMSNKEKLDVHKKIDKRLNELESKGIDVNSIIEKNVIANTKDERVGIAYRSIINLNKQLNTMIDKNISIDTAEKSNIEKKAIRILNNIHSMNDSKPSQTNKNIIEKHHADLLNKIDTIIDSKKLVKDWQEGRELKDQVSEIKNSFSLNKTDKMKTQQALINVKEQLKTPPIQLTKKEIVALNISVNKSQKEFDLKYKTNFLEIDKKLDQIQSKVNRALKEPNKELSLPTGENVQVDKKELPKLNNETIEKYNDVDPKTQGIGKLETQLKERIAVSENRALKEPNKELSLPTGENVQVDKKELPKLNNETIEKYNDVDDKYLSSLIKENKQQIAMLKQYDPKSQDIGKKAAKELVNLILKNKDQNITPIQKDQLNKKVINIQSQFKKNGIDINKTMDNQKKTITVNNNVQKIQEKTMKSHRAVGFDNSNRAIESLKKDVKETEQPRDTKRELTKRLEAVKNLVKQAVIDNSKDIDSKINQIKKLQGSIKNYKSDRNTSPSERFKNRKAIETITEKIGKLVKATEPLIKAAPKGTISKEVSQTIRDAKSITINRSKGMSR